MSADELSDALKSMPNFKEQMERCGLHINIHGTLFKKYADMKLESISEQEQASLPPSLPPSLLIGGIGV